MNLFKALGSIVESFTNIFVKSANTVGKFVDSFDHVADVCNASTETMRDEARHERNIAQKRLAQTMAELDQELEAINVQQSES